MKIGVMVALSVLIVLLSAQPVSGQSVSVESFSDKPNDLGHPAFYVDDAGLLVPMAYWPDTSPVCDAGYLDMLWGDMKLGGNGIMTARLTVAEPVVTDETVLPNSVTEVWWTWFFYKDTGYFEADYAIHLCWDGQAYECLVLMRGQESPVGLAESYSVVGDQVVVEFDGALIPDSVAWFAESICWVCCNPRTDLGYMPSSGWYAADLTDGPFLPWQPMPGY
ncbi:MAG: hypothetical protein AB1793_02780 [Candidatus Thermoplasmatota archaeon]